MRCMQRDDEEEEEERDAKMHDFLLLTWTCLKIQDSEGNAGQRQVQAKQPQVHS